MHQALYKALLVIEINLGDSSIFTDEETRA